MASEEGPTLCGPSLRDPSEHLKEIVSAHFTEVEERLVAVHAQVLALLSRKSEVGHAAVSRTDIEAEAPSGLSDAPLPPPAVTRGAIDSPKVAPPALVTTLHRAATAPLSPSTDTRGASKASSSRACADESEGREEAAGTLVSLDTYDTPPAPSLQANAQQQTVPLAVDGQHEQKHTDAGEGWVYDSYESVSNTPLGLSESADEDALTRQNSGSSAVSEEFDGASNEHTGLPNAVLRVTISGTDMAESPTVSPNLGRQSSVRFESKKFELVRVWTKRRGKEPNSPGRNIGRRDGAEGSQKIQSLSSHTSDLTEDEHLQALDDRHDRHYRDRDNWCKRWILHPQCRARVTWDTSAIFLVSFDMIFLPLQLFEIEDNFATTSLIWMCRLFWTFDIGASFLTGHIRRDGTIVMWPPKIALNYVMTWLLLDVFIVATDWVDFFMMQGNHTAYARMGKLTRIVRMVRLLRLLKIRNQFDIMLERFHSEYVLLVIGILKILFVLLAFAHLMACLWYGLSRGQSGKAWVSHYGLDRGPIADRYMASMHWSVSQFTGGMDEFVPHNLWERIFAIFAFLLAFILSCLFVSSITSSMTQLNILASSDALKLRHLRRYMLRNKIPHQLAMRVQRSAEQSIMNHQKNMSEVEVGALRYVSKPLLVEVHFVLYSGLLHVHTFFERYISQCPHVMKQVCHTAMHVQHNFVGEILFFPGETPVNPKMYIICSGTMQYVCGGHIRRHILRNDSWCSEANLWVHFTHQGELKCLADCRTCTIDARVFQEITSTFEQLEFDPSVYAAVFMKNLNEMAACEAQGTEAALDLMPPPDMDEEVLAAENAVNMRHMSSRQKNGTGLMARASIVGQSIASQLAFLNRPSRPSLSNQNAVQRMPPEPEAEEGLSGVLNRATTEGVLNRATIEGVLTRAATENKLTVGMATSPKSGRPVKSALKFNDITPSRSATSNF